jgi:hypothetical protein
MFKIMLNRNDANHANYDLRVTGNWRVIQKIDTQGLKQIGTAFAIMESGDSKGNGNLGMIVTVLFIIFALAIAFLYV